MSQEKQILHYLKAGHKLTPLEALKRFGCLRLSGRIFDLRQAGHRIAADIIEVGDGKHVAQYRLAKKAA